MFDELDRIVFTSGQQIFKEGDAGDCAYLIEEGAVEILATEQGVERRVSVIGKGEVFGEVALIDYQPRTATVRAIEETVLVPIPRKLVEGLLEKSDPILRFLILVILERFRNKQGSSAKLSASVGIPQEQSNLRRALRIDTAQKLSSAHGIARALTRNEFELYYQPICNLTDGRIAGFEALIRWHHPTDGMILPMDFLWLAEQAGLIGDLGLWTLERACRDWATLRPFTDVEAPFISVNLTADQLSSEMLTEAVKSIVDRHDMPAAELKLELLETAIIGRPEIVPLVLNKLIASGCSLALDDYGPGYSGLNRLHTYPIDTLKIDRIFIAHVLESEQSQETVRSSIVLAHSLGLNVVAQGIEDENVSAMLSALKCDLGQGWHFGSPATLQDLALRYAQNTPVHT
jgi:EAL domain-containing protein (putative c-di-GMP-specific phosphodiesterase class I)